jgi:hypothetical protein
VVFLPCRKKSRPAGGEEDQRQLGLRSGQCKHGGINGHARLLLLSILAPDPHAKRPLPPPTHRCSWRYGLLLAGPGRRRPWGLWGTGGLSWPGCRPGGSAQSNRWGLRQAAGGLKKDRNIQGSERCVCAGGSALCSRRSL